MEGKAKAHFNARTNSKNEDVEGIGLTKTVVFKELFERKLNICMRTLYLLAEHHD